MSKYSLEEIRIAAKEVHDEYYDKSYWPAREMADDLETQMILHGNDDPDSIYEFEKHSGLSYSRSR